MIKILFSTNEIINHYFENKYNFRELLVMPTRYNSSCKELKENEGDNTRLHKYMMFYTHNANNHRHPYSHIVRYSNKFFSDSRNSCSMETLVKIGRWGKLEELICESHLEDSYAFGGIHFAIKKRILNFDSFQSAVKAYVVTDELRWNHPK